MKTISDDEVGRLVCAFHDEDGEALFRLALAGGDLAGAARGIPGAKLLADDVATYTEGLMSQHKNRDVRAAIRRLRSFSRRRG